MTPRQACCRSLAKWTPIFALFALLMALMPPAGLQQMAASPEGEPAGAVAVDPGGAAAGHAAAIAGVALIFLLVLATRRHPDRQAPHDRAAGTYVVAMP